MNRKVIDVVDMNPTTTVVTVNMSGLTHQFKDR